MALAWLRRDQDVEVVTVTLDLGQGTELSAIREQALTLGAVRAHVLDAREQLARDFVVPALQAGAFAVDLGLGSALTRVLIATRLVDIARMESADAVANDLRRELLRQCEVAEYAMRANQVMSFFVPEQRGHDDLLNAAALVVQAQPLGAVRTATGRRRHPMER